MIASQWNAGTFNLVSFSSPDLLLTPDHEQPKATQSQDMPLITAKMTGSKLGALSSLRYHLKSVGTQQLKLYVLACYGGGGKRDGWH